MVVRKLVIWSAAALTVTAVTWAGITAPATSQSGPKAKAPLVEAKASLVEVKAPLVQAKAPAVRAKAPPVAAAPEPPPFTRHKAADGTRIVVAGEAISNELAAAAAKRRADFARQGKRMRDIDAVLHLAATTKNLLTRVKNADMVVVPYSQRIRGERRVVAYIHFTETERWLTAAKGMQTQSGWGWLFPDLARSCNIPILENATRTEEHAQTGERIGKTVLSIAGGWFTGVPVGLGLEVLSVKSQCNGHGMGFRHWLENDAIWSVLPEVLGLAASSRVVQQAVGGYGHARHAGRALRPKHVAGRGYRSTGWQYNWSN